MAFYRKTKLNRGTKENPVLSYIPRAVLVGKQITTKELSKRIAAESTASEADVRALPLRLLHQDLDFVEVALAWK